MIWAKSLMTVVLVASFSQHVHSKAVPSTPEVCHGYTCHDDISGLSSIHDFLLDLTARSDKDQDEHSYLSKLFTRAIIPFRVIPDDDPFTSSPDDDPFSSDPGDDDPFNPNNDNPNTSDPDDNPSAGLDPFDPDEVPTKTVSAGEEGPSATTEKPTKTSSEEPDIETPDAPSSTDDSSSTPIATPNLSNYTARYPTPTASLLSTNFQGAGVRAASVSWTQTSLLLSLGYLICRLGV